MADQESERSSSPDAALGPEEAWKILLALADRAKAGNALTQEVRLRLAGEELVLDDGGGLCVAPSHSRSWSMSRGHPQPAHEVAQMLDLYMPLCVGALANTLVVAHLGQSLDGRIATHTGASQFITGEENLVHAHRMRALFDAVLVGAHTAATDNPRLTTRLASGDHATRVLLDPRCSVDTSASIFTDGAARTIVICDEAHVPASGEHTHVGLPTSDGLFDCQNVLDALRGEGLNRIFVEGGGVTVSQFLHARRLHRLQVCVAPMIIGSGRPAFQLPEVDELGESIFMDCQHFQSGSDMLFDCQLRKNE